MANLLYQQIEMLSPGEAYRAGGGDLRHRRRHGGCGSQVLQDGRGLAREVQRGIRPGGCVFGAHGGPRKWPTPSGKSALRMQKKKNPNAEVGTEILTIKPTDVLGRIAAQTAKQVILQKVREAERDTIYNEYHTRTGELGHRDREAGGRPGPDRGHGANGSAFAEARTVQAGNLQHRRTAAQW